MRQSDSAGERSDRQGLWLVLTVLVVFVAQITSQSVWAAGDGQSRGIWYDSAGIGHDGISKRALTKAIEEEIGKFNRLHIDRVHIVLNAPFDKITRCECERSNNDGFAISELCGAKFRTRIMSGKQKKFDANVCTANAHFFAFDNWTYKTAKKDGSEEVLGIFVNALGRAHKQIVLTVWPTPNPNFITINGKAGSDLSTLINFVKRHQKYIWGIEFEDEENWVDEYAGEWGNRNVAADRLFDLLNVLPRSVKIGATVSPKGTITSRNIQGTAAKVFGDDRLLQRASFVSFQAYHPAYQKTNSTCVDGLNNLSGPVEPGEFQKRSVAAIEGADLSEKPIIMGVSAFQLSIGMKDGVCIDFQTCKEKSGTVYATSATKSVRRSASVKTDKACKDAINEIAIVNMFKGARAAICDNKLPRSIGSSFWSIGNLKANLDNRGLDYGYDVLEHCSSKDISKACGDEGEPSIDKIREICSGLDGKRGKGLRADRNREGKGEGN